LAIARLRKAGFPASDMDPAETLNSRTHYVRFHNTKTRRLKEAKERFPDILAALRSGATPAEMRIWLVQNVKGLGWKESSHFLRNIGHRDLAILDRHILRNLKRHGVIRTIPGALTPARYAEIERRFLRFAEALGIPMDELDLLFWSRETGQILK
jgi:N-glycosylase/DNA lyase